VKPQRRIARVVTVPPLAPGFVGPGHLASQVVSPEDFLLNDPFIVLMDDHFNIGDRTVGEPHPHAGFETVTLLLDGAIYDRDEGGVIEAGEVQWMTAGRGIIHGENVATKGNHPPIHVELGLVNLHSSELNFLARTPWLNMNPSEALSIAS
jgi:quercetin 2,3-dioxygenase